MRTRFLAIATAAAVAVSGVAAPVTLADEKDVPTAPPRTLVNSENFNKDEFKYKFDLPTAKPQDVILQVGETQDSVMLNWTPLRTFPARPCVSARLARVPRAPRKFPRSQPPPR
nr:Uncharacterised protein [Streptococcus thermophilus]